MSSVDEGLQPGDAVRLILNGLPSKGVSVEVRVQVAQAAALLYVGDMVAGLIELLSDDEP